MQYLLPVATLLFVCFGSLLALLFHLTSVQDRMERERSRAAVSSTVTEAKRQIAHDLSDYVQWDESVVRLVRRFDAAWANSTLAAYLGVNQAYDHVIVMGSADRPLFSFRNGEAVKELDLEAALGPSVMSGLAAVRGLPPSARPLLSGFSRAGDAVYVFAVGKIIPLTADVTLPPGSTHAIVIARRVNRSYLDNLHVGETPSLRLLEGAKPDGWDQLVLTGTTGEAVGKLAWQPTRPGTSLRGGILPAFVIIGLVSFLSAGVVLRRGQRAIKALQYSEIRALHLAKHDPLTGLPNRRAMQDEIQSLLDAQKPLSLLYIDLDGFKETNDVYGHGAGDELLRAVASRLIEIVPSYHIVGRIGGDEFAVLLAEPGSHAETVGAMIIEGFSQPFCVAGFQASLGASIGLATNDAAKSTAEVLRRADTAMYAAKAAGKHCLRSYGPEIDADREHRKVLERDLRLALQNGEVTVVFQPIVSASDHEIVAVEALARWHHPDYGNVPPDQFIPIAEESGLIVSLGQHVLTSACVEARDWGVSLAVNLSPAQFWDRGLTATIMEVLAKTGFPADRLELEITEGYLLRRPDAAGDVLRELRAAGIRISLDDFGTGFASIGYLQQLGFDSIKIDRSFVAAAVAQPKAAALARAIVAIGDALDLPVTAEGVELAFQATLMREAGCSRLQGWHFGKPTSGAVLRAWFTERRKVAI